MSSYAMLYFTFGLVYSLWGMCEIVLSKDFKNERRFLQKWTGLLVFFVGAATLWPIMIILDFVLFFVINREK